MRPRPRVTKTPSACVAAALTSTNALEYDIKLHTAPPSNAREAPKRPLLATIHTPAASLNLRRSRAQGAASSLTSVSSTPEALDLVQCACTALRNTLIYNPPTLAPFNVEAHNGEIDLKDAFSTRTTSPVHWMHSTDNVSFWHENGRKGSA